MDKTETKPKPWSWLPAAMPGVARLVREKRAKLGDERVNECWQRGVVERKPGWFFAAEGAITVGTPDVDQRAQWFSSLQISPTQVLLYLGPPETIDGTH